MKDRPFTWRVIGRHHETGAQSTLGEYPTKRAAARAARDKRHPKSGILRVGHDYVVTLPHG